MQPSFSRNIRIYGIFLVLSCLAGSQLYCQATEVYNGRISLETLDPDKRPCQRDYECNNLKYQGRCTDHVCRSEPRPTCPQTGETRICRLALQQGQCIEGNQTCQASPLQDIVWGDCVFEDPKQRALCTLGCKEGEVRECFSDKTGCWLDDQNRFRCYSPCYAGTQRCVAGQWGRCVGEQVPSKEVCNGVDDDCDGKIDANPDGTVLSSDCYTASLKTRNLGVCRYGVQVCADGKWNGCFGEQTPRDEECNGLDDNCNGTIDDNAICPDGLSCIAGQCKIIGSPADAGNPDYGPISDTSRPDASSPDRGRPDIGSPDSSPPMDLGSPQDTSPQDILIGAENPGTDAPIPDVPGHEQSKADAGPPETALETIPESPPVDRNPPPECVFEQTRPCYSGAPETYQHGICKQGQQTCLKTGRWGPCTGQILPKAEECNGVDDDCNGRIDDGPNQNLLTQPCYTGPQGTSRQGICRLGVKFCQNAQWSPCVGQVTPQKEVCNNQDDDCNGKIDDVAGCY